MAGLWTRVSYGNIMTVEEMLHHPALIVPLDSETHVGAAAGLYERVLLEHGRSLETIAKHLKATRKKLDDFSFHPDYAQHLTHRAAFYQTYYKDHPHAVRAA